MVSWIEREAVKNLPDDTKHALSVMVRALAESEVPVTAAVEAARSIEKVMQIILEQQGTTTPFQYDPQDVSNLFRLRATSP